MTEPIWQQWASKGRRETNTVKRPSCRRWSRLWPGSLSAAETPPSAALCCCRSRRNSDTDSDRETITIRSMSHPTQHFTSHYSESPANLLTSEKQASLLSQSLTWLILIKLNMQQTTRKITLKTLEN